MNEFNWEEVDCCWDVVTPVVTMIDDEGSPAKGSYPSSGNCMAPAFPPSDSYLTAERGADGTNEVSIDVMATGDITST